METGTREVIEDNKGMSKLLRNCFLSVFTEENLSSVLERVQVCEGDKDMLRELSITEQVVREETEK